MERESNPMEALCRSGCGFYGNPATEGLCSVCFKEAVKKKQQPPASTPSPSAATFAPAPAPAPAPATPLAAAVPTVPTVPIALTHNDKLEEESAAGTSGASAGASDTDPDDKDPSKDKKKKNRCAVCRKKVGLTGFECRCGGLFCALHRYSDKHECSFDYRELGAQEIRRNNPVVVSQKIDKI